jgi:Short C-terminal domain
MLSPVKRRVAYIVTVLVFVVSLTGFVVTMMLNSFEWADWSGYGEVPVPGTGTVHLPSGKVSVSFNATVIGNTRGELPVPQLSLTIIPPAGVPDPPVTESWGNTTTINNNSYRQVWIAQISQAGDYTIKTDGKVNGYISPQLAFGHDSARAYVPWIFAGLFPFVLASFIYLRVSGSRAKKKRAEALRAGYVPGDHFSGGIVSGGSVSGRHVSGAQPADQYVPTDEGVKLQELQVLSELHAAGSLSDAEFEAERRRILGK